MPQHRMTWSGLHCARTIGSPQVMQALTDDDDILEPSSSRSPSITPLGWRWQMDSL